jgi:hypothetical protein
MNSWNLQIKGDKAIRLPQDWGHMLRLILATFPMEEIKERLFKSQERKSAQKYLRKSRKWKIFQLIERGDSIQTHGCIDVNQEFTRCGNHPNILPVFERFGRSLTSLLSSLRHEVHQHLPKWRPKAKGVEEGCLPQQPYGSIYSVNKRLECPCGLKGKLHLMKGSLVRHLLRCTRRHRTNRLSLHFHAISMMMPCVPPTVAPSLVLRQN